MDKPEVGMYARTKDEIFEIISLDDIAVQNIKKSDYRLMNLLQVGDILRCKHNGVYVTVLKVDIRKGTCLLFRIIEHIEKNSNLKIDSSWYKLKEKILETGDSNER